MLHVQIRRHDWPSIQILQTIQRRRHTERNVGDRHRSSGSTRDRVSTPMQLERHTLLCRRIRQKSRKLPVLIPVRLHRHITKLERHNAPLHIGHGRRHGDVEKRHVCAFISFNEPTPRLRNVDREVERQVEWRLRVRRACRRSPCRLLRKHQRHLIQLNCLNDVEMPGREMRRDLQQLDALVKPCYIGRPCVFAVDLNRNRLSVHHIRECLRQGSQSMIIVLVLKTTG